MEWIQPTGQSRTRAALALSWVLCSGRASAEILAAVGVQGVGPFPFLVDTGADSTVVHPDLAREAGLRPTARIELVTLAGIRLVPQAPATIVLEDGTTTSVDVLIHELSAARAQHAGVRGILGRDALGMAPFTLDHARRRLVREARSAAGAIPYELVEGRPLIEARLGCGGPALRLALDSGANGVVLFGDGSRPLALDASSVALARTNGGTASLRAGRIDCLCVGGRRLTDVAIAVQERSHAPGRVEDGLLPTRLFARVHFDPRARTVTLEPW